jgi:glutamyl-tRNA synthetase
MSQTVVTRFAPSPTGMLHIGGVRTALFCWLYARRHGGRFILRVEDTDLSRSTDENIRIIEDGMAWVGLDWDEGPVPGSADRFKGPHGPYRQMMRMDQYRAGIQGLLDQGQAYRCRCSREDLDARRKAAEQSSLPFQYGRGLDEGKGCRDKNFDASEPFSVRLKMPLGFEPWLEDGAIVLKDIVKGRIDFPATSLDDWIIARTGEGGEPGVPTYNFCVVVDDTSMEVTHVIRGDDHVPNTPKQIALYHAMGFEPPRFAHVPMILGKDGAKLSKRHGATSITEYQEMGFLPSAVRLALARLSWTPKVDGQAPGSAEEELLTDAQMIELFDLDDLQKSPARFDMDKLSWVNQKLIQRASWQELEPHLAPFLPADFRDRSGAWKATAIQCTQKGKSLKEMALALAFVWTRPGTIDPAHLQKFVTEAVQPALREVADLTDYDHAALEAAFPAILERHALKLKDLAQALRVLLAGGPVSPPIFDTLGLLGRDEVRARILPHLTNAPHA